MPHHGRHRPVTQGEHEPQRVARQVQHVKRAEVAVVIRAPTGGAAVAALVRGDHVIARRRQRRHHLAPGPRQFGEAVQQQDARTPRRFEPGFQDVHAQPIDAIHKARADTGGEDGGVQWGHRGSLLGSIRSSLPT